MRIANQHLPNPSIQTMQAGPNNPTAFADAAEMRHECFSDDGYLFGTEPNVWLRKTCPLPAVPK